jgi:hypothetical protein
MKKKIELLMICSKNKLIPPLMHKQVEKNKKLNKKV